MRCKPALPVRHQRDSRTTRQNDFCSSFDEPAGIDKSQPSQKFAYDQIGFTGLCNGTGFNIAEFDPLMGEREQNTVAKGINLFPFDQRRRDDIPNIFCGICVRQTLKIDTAAR